MGSTLEEKLQRLSPERRKKIEERTALLIAEETTRQRLRQLFKISQENHSHWIPEFKVEVPFLTANGQIRVTEKEADFLVEDLTWNF